MRSDKTNNQKLFNKRICAVMVVGILLIFAVIVKNDFGQIHGLKGDYFSDHWLKIYDRSRIDPVINFNFRSDGPFPDFNKDYFSIRWTGTVYAPEPGEYHFLTISDDAVRLWVANELIIDNWKGHSTEIDRGVINLSRGFHKVKLEYNDFVLDARIKLLWKKPSEHEPRIIPSKYLRPPE